MKYWQEEKYAEAEQYFEKIIDIIEKRFYKDHPTIAPYLEYLVSIAIKRNNWIKAEELCSRDLIVRQQSLSPNNVHTLEATRCLAAIKRHLEKYAEAEALLKKVMPAVENGTIAPYEEFLYELSQVYAQEGKKEEAEKNYKLALSLFHDRHGKFKRFATCLHDYADLLKSIGRESEASYYQVLAEGVLDSQERRSSAQNVQGEIFFEPGLYAATIMH